MRIHNKLHVGGFLLIILAAAAAGKWSYQSGELITIDTDYYRMRLPLSSSHDALLPVRKIYRLGIQLGDIVYLADCEERKYKSEWRIHTPVEFRIDKQRLFLKRPNGKELEFLLLGTVPASTLQNNKPN